MIITDTSGTHTFAESKSSDIDNYFTDSRYIKYKDIAKHNSSTSIGSDIFIQFDFFQLTRAELTELNLIYTTNKSNNASITQIDNSDEVLVGETYTKLLGATNGIFIETPKFKEKQSIKSKGIKYWNTRLLFRVDTATEHTKV